MFSKYTSKTNQASVSIDLHGLSVKDAKVEVERTFFESIADGDTDITIITGIGNHVNSNGTRGVLYSALPKWLEDSVFRDHIRSISKDMGAYEIQFKGDDEFAPKVQQLKSNFSFLPKEAIDDLHKKAKEGDKRSQGELGTFYVLGICVKQDIKKGISLLSQAAETLVERQVQLGDIFSSNDFHSIKNYKTSRNWYLKAEKNNHPDALFELGGMYWLGRGVISDNKKGIEYYTRAAFFGNSDAAYELMDIYFNPFDNESKNQVLAATQLYFQGVKTVTTHAQIVRAKEYFYRWCIAMDFEVAFQYLEDEAEEDATAQYYLGKLYMMRGEKGDKKRAGVCFKKAADKAEINARFEVALEYLTGVGQKKNVPLAIDLLTKLTAEKHPNSMFLLSEQLTSPGPLQNIPRAIELLISAAQLEQIDAQNTLINYYLENKHTNQITKKIFNKIANQLEKKAKAGNPKAQYHMGMLHSKGSIRFPQSVDKTIDYLGKSAAQGNTIARNNLIPFLHAAPVTKDTLKKLIISFTEAAEEGEASAQFNLGKFLLTPSKMNPVIRCGEGYYWIYQAALKKNSPAIKYLKENFLAGNKESIIEMVAAQFKFRDGIETLPVIPALKNIVNPNCTPKFFSPAASQCSSSTSVAAKPIHPAAFSTNSSSSITSNSIFNTAVTTTSTKASVSVTKMEPK
jgi:TPR repeat protein